MLDQDTIAKLTVTLAGDTELFNTVINDNQETQAEITKAQEEAATLKTKLEEAEQRGQNYLGQISNLLSKIPVGNSSTPQSFDQKIEEIAGRTWTK